MVKTLSRQQIDVLTKKFDVLDKEYLDKLPIYFDCAFSRCTTENDYIEMFCRIVPVGTLRMYCELLHDIISIEQTQYTIDVEVMDEPFSDEMCDEIIKDTAKKFAAFAMGNPGSQHILINDFDDALETVYFSKFTHWLTEIIEKM